MPNPLKRIWFFRRNAKKADDAAGSPRLQDIDAETLEIARELAFEKRLKRDVSAKWRRGKKGDAESDEEALMDALKAKKPNATEIMKKVFARTAEDTVLANRFADKDGKTVGHLTVKKAVAMDGLRDLDDDVGVSSRVASPMNPEGRFNMPVAANGSHQFAERFNEAMNPIRNGRFNSTIPEQILEHFANFSTFIGYTMCEVIGTHPTVSNACTIPGEDAIAPGYNLGFVDSDDLNGNGIPDDLETAEMGGVKRAMGRIGAMEGLKEAIATLGGGGEKKVEVEGRGRQWNDTESLNALALALERLAAYEEWERDEGAGEDAALAVNEGFVKPVTDAFGKFSVEQSDDNRKGMISALTLALHDIAEREHPSLDEVRANANRRGTIAAVAVAYTALTEPVEDWDLKDALNKLAVAVERVGAYEKLSDRNAEAMVELTNALTTLSAKEDDAAREAAAKSVGTVKSAMDAADFDFVDPVQAQQHALQLEKERLEDRKTKAAWAAEDRQTQANWAAEDRKAKADAAAKLAAAKEGRVNDLHQQKLAINQQLADEKLREQQAQFAAAQEAQAKEAEAQAQQAQIAQAQQQQAAEAKKREEEKNDKVKRDAEVAKERQKFLDRWKQRADDMGLNDICARLARNARIFGIGIAVPVVDGADYEKPLDFDQIREGSYRGFTIIEPTWIYPEVDSEDLINPLSPTFFEPMYWAATGSTNIGSLGIRRIHRSWMIIVRNKELPNMLRPMYYYGGIPLTQEIYEAVYCADKVMNEVPKLAMTKRTTVVKGDPNDMVTNPEGVVDRLQAFSQVQDNFGILYVGRNADVQKLETSLSEFDQLIAKCNQRIAAIAKMPETKLFKTQLAGMNSAGRYEWDDYSQLLINIQNNWFKPLLSLHYKLDTKSRTGKVIDLKVSFNPIDVPTQAEKGETESRVVQTINSAVQGGWLTAGEARTIARSREDSMFSSVSAEMPEELSQTAQPPMGGGMPGMPTMGEEQDQ